MHVNAFDRYQAGTSLIHRLDPRVKVAVTVLFILSNVLLPDGAWLAFLLTWLMVVLISALAGLGAGYAARRSFVALPFALAAVTALFSIPGPPAAALHLGPLQATITQPGLLRFLSIVVRSWISVQIAILLVATTQFPDLIHALRHLHVPSVLVAIISFMYRYLFVLSDEAMRLNRARESRSARPSGSPGSPPLPWRAQVTGHMAGQLFLRSYERSDRIYNAMLARGYQGNLLTLHAHQMRRLDWLAGIAACLALLAFQLLARI